jgi:hypothetical protein
MMRRIAAMTLACVAVSLAGCAGDPREGYSMGSAFDRRVSSVEVRIFDNLSFNHGMEVRLADAIVKEIQTQTPWQVRTGSLAQTTLTGTITDVRLRARSVARETGLVQEQAVEVTLDFQWRDNRSGDVLASRRGVRAVETFVPALGASERIEIGEDAAVQEAAREVVAALRSGW